MRLAISNIAWDPHEDDGVALLLARYQLDAIDVAPTKYFPNPREASDELIKSCRLWWQEKGISITGMQSLLFGTEGLNLFGAKIIQQNMLEHLRAICRIAQGLGATRLVFGSPKNRDLSSIAADEVIPMAVHFFKQLGEIALEYGVVICLEPNPVCYGANFMTHLEETVQIAKQVAHPAIAVQCDLGSMIINQEDPMELLAQYAPYIGHVHLSEPQLVALGDHKTSDHRHHYQALSRYLPQLVWSIEMLCRQDEPGLVAIERALKTACIYYRDDSKEHSLCSG
jgi:D-psicose/D-tagatose/L-ribulose 3-epimerase